MESRAKVMRQCLGAISVVACCCFLFPADASAQLRAGAAKVDITPPLGVSLDGSISKNGPATSIHDPLHARALVLADSVTTIAIVVVDQCMTGRDVFDAAKESIERTIGIPVDRMLMSATHTHAAPRTIHIGTSAIDDEYHRQLGEWIAEAVSTAQKNLRPAKFAFASFEAPELIACRRFLCEPGSVRVNPFGMTGEQIKSVAGASSAVIGPAGPTDPQFSVVSVQHDDGTPLAVLGNFSVHYCGGYSRGAVSADYFGYFCNAVEASLSEDQSGTPVIGILSNGTSGDTGSFQRLAGQKFRPFERMEYFGRALADRAMDAIKDVPHRGDVSISMAEAELELAIRRPDEQRLRWAREMLAKPESHPHRWTKIYAEEALHLSRRPPRKSIKLQAIRIGDIGIAAAPCEVFAETGLAIKDKSPIKHTFTIELANGYAGYLPTLQQHQWGGYESWPARSSLLEVGAEEKIRRQLQSLLSDVAR